MKSMKRLLQFHTISNPGFPSYQTEVDSRFPPKMVIIRFPGYEERYVLEDKDPEKTTLKYTEIGLPVFRINEEELTYL